MHALTPRLTLFPAAALLALSMAAAPAHAFSDDEARRAILELRAKVQQLNEQNRQARLQLADQLDQMRHELATMRGKLEELGHPVSAGQSSSGQGLSEAARNADPQQRAAYEAAATQYRSGNYKEAASAFSTFVESYPDGELTSNALFYLGSSQYASKDFKNSIQTMKTLVEKYPQDSRAADALLVAAADQIELNDIDGAKANLQKIIKDYPNSSAAETAKSRMKLL